MGATTYTEMPESFYAGESLSLDLSFSEYRADDGWTLTVYIAGKSVGVATGTANGSRFSVSFAATTTADLEAGNYVWRAIASKAGVTAIAGSGTVKVVANIAKATAGAMQTFEERMLGVVEAVLEGRITQDIEAFQIAGRAVTKIPVRELVQLREVYKRAVDAQQNPGRHRPQMRVSFTGTESEA